jgi:hypothetical protein
MKCEQQVVLEAIYGDQLTCSSPISVRAVLEVSVFNPSKLEGPFDLEACHQFSSNQFGAGISNCRRCQANHSSMHSTLGS